MAIVITSAATGCRLRPARVAAALALNAAAHYAIDYRRGLALVADALGKREFWRLGDGSAAPCGTGAYALDQTAHRAVLWVSALPIASH